MKIISLASLKKSLILILVFIIAYFFFIFISNKFSPQDVELKAETILIGNQPVSIPSGNFLIKDQTEFNNIWKKILGEDSSPPTMDFSSKIAVAVISEQKSTSGFSLVVDKVFLKDNFVEVNISEISPGQNCFLTQSIAQSFHVFSLPKFEKEYKLNIISKIQNCF